jgi:hypothetical protein
MQPPKGSGTITEVPLRIGCHAAFREGDEGLPRALIEENRDRTIRIPMSRETRLAFAQPFQFGQYSIVRGAEAEKFLWFWNSILLSKVIHNSFHRVLLSLLVVNQFFISFGKNMAQD